MNNLRRRWAMQCLPWRCLEWQVNARINFISEAWYSTATRVIAWRGVPMQGKARYTI